MHVVTAEQMRSAERATFASGVPEAALMESAGRHVADHAARMLPQGGSVTVLCGPGHNGGDGLVAARYLLNRGFRVHLILTRPVDRLSDLLQAFFGPLPAMGATVHQSDALVDCHILYGSDLIIDALLGTGTQGPPRGAIRQAVGLIENGGRPVLSVDIPTGVDADTGRVHEPCVEATCTVAMSAAKPGHLLLPGAAYCGELAVVDVGIPQQCISREARATWVRPVDGAAWFPPRPLDSHKGLFGKMLVIAGSSAMPGAAVLAVQAGLRSGVGLCSWAGPAGMRLIIAASAPEATLFPLGGDHDSLSASDVELALGAAQGRAIALGPGIGLSPKTGRFVAEFLSSFTGPVVVDADGLTHLAQLGRWPHHTDTPRVLTPHPKEMARLLHVELDAVLHDRLGAVREAAERYQAVVLLKGVPTLVAQPGGHVHICRVGNPVLSVGGSGDVLTGLVTGLLAQGLSPIQSATLGALWHGTAADILARDGESAGHTAGELVNVLARARAQLLSEVKPGAL